MKVVELRERFGLENLTLASRSEPTAGPGQVVLQMLAASPNYRDLLMVLGQYNPKQRLPMIPGSFQGTRTTGVAGVLDLGVAAGRAAAGRPLEWCHGHGRA